MDDPMNLSPEEEKILNGEDEGAATPPPPPAPEPAEPGAPPPPPPPAAAPVAPTPAVAPAPAQTEDERIAAFMEQHKDKSPEELLRIAAQQATRANREAYDARKSTEKLESIATRAREALEARKGKVAADRTAFEQLLQDDPDAATKQMAERFFTAEERQAETEAQQIELEARVGAAHELASAAIPEWDSQAKNAYAFGQEIGYSKEELGAVVDGRDLVTLHLASLAARYIKAGAMDMHGNFLQPPETVVASDPRLTAPPPPATLSSAPGRAANAGKTVEQELTDLLNLPQKDFDKLSDEDLIRLTGGQ